jgi:hypothetical protein
LPPASAVSAGAKRVHQDVVDGDDSREKRTMIGEEEEVVAAEKISVLEEEIKKAREAAEQQFQTHRSEMNAAPQAAARLAKMVTEVSSIAHHELYADTT